MKTFSFTENPYAMPNFPLAKGNQKKKNSIYKFFFNKNLIIIV